MALRSNFQVSTQPITLRLLILNMNAQRGDYESLAQLLVARTDLSIEEVLALELAEVNTVCDRIAEGLNQANILFRLGKDLDGSNG